MEESLAASKSVALGPEHLSVASLAVDVTLGIADENRVQGALAVAAGETFLYRNEKLRFTPFSIQFPISFILDFKKPYLVVHLVLGEHLLGMEHLSLASGASLAGGGRNGSGVDGLGGGGDVILAGKVRERIG